MRYTNVVICNSKSHTSPADLQITRVSPYNPARSSRRRSLLSDGTRWWVRSQSSRKFMLNALRLSWAYCMLFRSPPQIYIMLCLNFDFYIIPLTLLLGFLKQYVICMLMVDRNVNPEDQVRPYFSLLFLNTFWQCPCGLTVCCWGRVKLRFSTFFRQP